MKFDPSIHDIYIAKNINDDGKLLTGLGLSLSLMVKLIF